MRPSICFLRNRNVSASKGELVHFVASNRGIERKQRVNNADRTLPSHHRDRGWFCDTHTDVEVELLTTQTIKENLRSMRKKVSRT